MELTHTFTVPATIEETWAAFQDIESVAGCFPGAQVTSVEGDTFQGSCKVKLGPIALVYNGSGTFLEKDEAAHTMKIEAKGKDKRGNGTAGAHVRAALVGHGTETTVEVITDLAITGKPAQFGRGVMQDVSDKLLGQFVACLQTKVGAPPAPVEQAPAAGHAATEPTSAPQPMTQPTPQPMTQPTPQPVSQSAPPSIPGPAENDALDLGTTVLPILAKAYWKQALAGGVVIAVIVYVATR